MSDLLFDPVRHEALTASVWDADRAHAAIERIVADMQAHFDPVRGWPDHPRDDVDTPLATGMKSLYLGAAGNLWALWFLQRAGAVTLRIDPSQHMARVHADYLREPDTGSVVPSYFLGEAGVLLIQWRLTGESEAADRLFRVVRENIPNPTNEALWAAPGTMVAAWHMWRWTGESRWSDLFADNVEQLWRTWIRSELAPCHVWIQDLYGRIVQLLGAGHGFAGNADALLRGAALLPEERRAALFARCVETLTVTAVHDGETANWPSGRGPPRAGRGPLVQWCHGAPGILTGIAHFPQGVSTEMEALLERAGNLVWRAGPLAKGSGLCHGTAGNGYAFLALYARTGNPVWLARARAFAMHAMEQQERMQAEHGRGRYTLWTGDAGVAVYLWHCVKGAGSMPGLDALD